MSFLEQKVFKYLCPPGNGVFTVHTAKEHKEKLHKFIFQTTHPEEVQTKWKKKLSELQSIHFPCLLGITSDTGGGIQRGANWGPLFIRNSLIGQNHLNYFDLGDVKTIPHLLHDKYLNNDTLTECRKALYGVDNALPVSPLSICEDFCENFYALYPEKKIIGLGGDHSVSYGLVKPWLQSRTNMGKKVAIIHFDAHTDLMANRLGVDICFASWAYHMLDYLEKPTDLIQLGIRSSARSKGFWETELGVKQYWANEFNQLDLISKEICDYLKAREIDEVYISFDIDALDSEYASSTGTPEKNGLQPHQCTMLIEAIASVVQVTGADLVEVAPFVKSSLASNLTPEPDTTLLSSKIILEKLIEVMN